MHHLNITAEKECMLGLIPKASKKRTVTSIKKNNKLMGEVGMAVQESIQTRVVGIIHLTSLLLYHYLKSSSDVTCALLSLLPLFVYFHPYFTHQIVFYACELSFRWTALLHS